MPPRKKKPGRPPLCLQAKSVIVCKAVIRHSSRPRVPRAPHNGGLAMPPCPVRRTVFPEELPEDMMEIEIQRELLNVSF